MKQPVIWLTCAGLMITLSVIPPYIWGSQIDPDAKLAEWQGGYLTVGAYINWWQRMDPKERPQLATIEDKKKFLNNVVSAQLVITEAERLGLDTLPGVQEWMTKQKANLLKKLLEQDVIEPRAKVSPEKIEEMYNRRMMQITASHIVVPTADLAKAIIDSLMQGASFEDLAIRYSTDASAPKGGYLGPVRWGDFSDRWCQRAFALEPGQVSEPLMTESGYIIIKVHTKQAASVENPEVERRRVEYSLYKQKYSEEASSYRDSLMLAYEVAFNDQAVIRLATRFAQKMDELGLSSTVIEEDIVPDLLPDEERLNVVTYKGGSFTCGELVDMILSYPYPARPRYDDPDQLIEFVTKQLVDTLYIAEALKRGLDRDPRFLQEIEKIRYRRLTTALYRYVTADISVPDDSVRNYYETHIQDYMTGPGYFASKIVVGTKEAADSVLARIRAGEAFETLARQRSRDPFTAPRGGDMGFIPKGNDPEFDEFFAQMKEGDIDIFRSVEGWVVLWLRQVTGTRVRPLEEVSEYIRNKLLGIYKDRFVEKWIEEKRNQVGVKINADLLSRIEIPSQ